MAMLRDEVHVIQGMFSQFLEVIMTRDPTMIPQTSQEFQYILDPSKPLLPPVTTP